MNRRSFLTIAMGGTAAAALLSSASAAPNRKLRKAIMHSTIGVQGSVLEKYRVMKQAGFDINLLSDKNDTAYANR